MSPLRTTLTLLIIAEGQQRKLPFDPDDSPFEHDVQNVIARLLRDWTDERKADLYSLIVDLVSPDMPMTKMESQISWALAKNEARFGHV